MIAPLVMHPVGRRDEGIPPYASPSVSRRRGRRPRRPVHAKAYPARTVRRIRSLYEFAGPSFLFIPYAAGTSGGRPLRR